MSYNFNDEVLEKIRYQLGQIIKSWSRVERIITDNYVAYKVKKDGSEFVFAYLLNEYLILSTPVTNLSTQLKIDYKKYQDEPVIPEIDTIENGVVVSFQKYRFTEMVPDIEKYYRSVILNLPH